MTKTKMSEIAIARSRPQREESAVHLPEVDQELFKISEKKVERIASPTVPIIFGKAGGTGGLRLTKRECGQQGVQSRGSFQADGRRSSRGKSEMETRSAIVAQCLGAFVALVRHQMLQSQA
uniref:(northern house mosquito) hypothetical protein n=1 Tax=Culex pipiens TaxID=7175 RepID=A0A8D8EZI4_CULPI